MKAVIRRVTVVGEMILHQVSPDGRYAIEIAGLDMQKLLCDSVRVGLKTQDVQKKGSFTPFWELGPVQIEIGPMQGIEQLINPEQYRGTEYHKCTCQEKDEESHGD